MIKAHMIAGVQLVKNDFFKTRDRVKTHRKRRLDKKFLKRYGYESKPDPNLYHISGKFYGHPVTIELLLQQIKSNPARSADPFDVVRDKLKMMGVAYSDQEPE